MPRHQRTITKMDEHEWRAVASQMFIIERETNALMNMLTGRTRLRAVAGHFKLVKAVGNLKSDLENEMYNQGIRSLEIFYPGEENQAHLIEAQHETRKKMISAGRGEAPPNTT